ncbi:MAG: TonB-dependent receptor, partial [Ignavibacteriaceae bacterium]|nr:TonB-dependent receptor [Ignavibacteriaceae bacterium]
VVKIGNNFYDESPFGVFSGFSSGIGSSMNMGLGYSNSRDSSKVYTWSSRFDFSSQLNKIMAVKAGVEFIYTDNNVNYALIEPSLPTSNSTSKWHTFPVRGAIYGQTKLEFEGMIANIGLRLDYSHAGGEWYLYDAYNKAFSGAYSSDIDNLLMKESTEKILSLSPRLGVAFPITVNSKLFFNYGHFRSMPAPENLYLLRRNTTNNAVTRLANPNNPLPKTVAYELGYEHNLGDMFLLRLAGYYKDVSDESRLVGYISRDNSVSYSVPEPNMYRDIRGFEVTLTKNRGEWITGFVNYTYMVASYGYFGLPTYYENPALQRESERNTALFDQVKPVPQPYGRANIDIFTPMQFGPEIGGIYLLEDIRINLLATWSSGTYFAWTGPGGTRPGFSNNIQWKDFYNFDMRISKTFRLGPVGLEMFADISNLFNIKYLDYRAGFVDAKDYDAYMQSLHLASEFSQFGYKNIVGEDKPGDVRTGEYIPWDDNASESQKEEWRKNKSYIDMPNLAYTAFLNPRAIYWGLRIMVELK